MENAKVIHSGIFELQCQTKEKADEIAQEIKLIVSGGGSPIIASDFYFHMIFDVVGICEDNGEFFLELKGVTFEVPGVNPMEFAEKALGGNMTTFQPSNLTIN